MAWLALYGLLIAAFVAAYFFPAGGHFGPAEAIKDTTALLGGVAGFLQALARVNLNFYLFLQRVRIWWARNETSHWRFALRADGLGSNDPLQAISDCLGTSFARWQPRIVVFKLPRNMVLVIDRTIHLTLSFVPADESEDECSHLIVSSDELEVAFGNAESKLDDSVVPILNGFLELLRPEQSSVTLEVSFRKSCPFFSFYVEHLKPEQVKNFNLVFTPHLGHGDADRVTVTQSAIEISAGTIGSMRRLAKGLLMLSSEAVALTRG